jgi:hypothetical protein
MRLNLIALIFAVTLAEQNFAQDSNHFQSESTKKPEGAVDKGVDAAKDVYNKSSEYLSEKVEEIRVSPTTRESRLLNPTQIGIEPISPGLLFPIKSGYFANYSFDADHRLGIEYISGGTSIKLSKINLVSFKESLILVPYQYYFGSNSFFMKVAYGIRKYAFRVGDSVLNSAAEYLNIEIEDLSNKSFIEVENDVVLFGLGNQWQFEGGFVFGFDWFELIIPVGDGKVKETISAQLTANDAKNVRSAIDYMETGVTFNMLKVNLGWSF